MDIRVTRDEMIPYIKKVWAGIQDENIRCPQEITRSIQ